jgi:broad specificity phosphatase PhoE
MTARLILISHAPTQAQRHAAFPSDEPILEKQIANFSSANWIAPPADRVFSAPELRARQTTRLLRLTGETCDELRDCDYGTWRGRQMDRLQAEDPEGILAWLTRSGAAPHRGESIDNLMARVGRWMEAQKGATCTIAVTHPALIRAAVIYALQIPAQSFWRFDIPPLSLTDVRFRRGLWTVRSTGCPLRTWATEDEVDS